MSRTPLARLLPLLQPLRRRCLLAGLALTLGGVGPALVMSALVTPARAMEERAVALEARRDLGVTLYQNDLALILDHRWVALTEGVNRLAIEGVSPAVIVESLTLSSSLEGLSLLEQSWEPADLTPNALLQRAVGRRVLLVTRDAVTGSEASEEAVLLSLAAGPVLRVGERIEIAPPGRIVLPTGPETALKDLRAKPALLLTIESGQTGPGEIELSYLTHGLSWRGGYTAVLSPDGKTLKLDAMMTLINNTDVAFQQASLRLIAGEVDAGPRPLPRGLRGAEMAMMQAEAAAPPPTAAGERYLYLIDRPVDIGPGEQKQLTLFPTAQLPVRQTLRFENLIRFGQGAREIGPQPAALRLTLTNLPEGRPAVPLPAGTLRIYERPGSGPLLFSGADAIPNTPAGATRDLDLGTAFDVTATGRQTAFERLSQTSFESAQEVVLRNAKSTAVEVEVVADLPPGWKMLEESGPHEAETAGRLIWRVAVPAGGESILTFRARVDG